MLASNCPMSVRRVLAMKRALVIDDSSAIRKVARRILERFDFEVTEADSTQAGLDACRERMPDVYTRRAHARC